MDLRIIPSLVSSIAVRLLRLPRQSKKARIEHRSGAGQTSDDHGVGYGLRVCALTVCCVYLPKPSTLDPGPLSMRNQKK